MVAVGRRRGWHSNPRWAGPTHAFQACRFGRSRTPPEATPHATRTARAAGGPAPLLKNWKLGRLAKIGLSAAVLPTLLVGLVALEQTDTAPSTTDGSELVKHLSDLNQNKPQPDNDKSPDDGKDQPDNDGEDNRCADAESKEEQFACRNPSGVLP